MVCGGQDGAFVATALAESCGNSLTKQIFTFRWF